MTTLNQIAVAAVTAFTKDHVLQLEDAIPLRNIIQSACEEYAEETAEHFRQGIYAKLNHAIKLIESRVATPKCPRRYSSCQTHLDAESRAATAGETLQEYLEQGKGGPAAQEWTKKRTGEDNGFPTFGIFQGSKIIWDGYFNTEADTLIAAHNATLPTK